MSSDTTIAKPALRRVLGLWALVIYGIIMIQPTAPMAPYGEYAEAAGGHVVTTILMAMVAMLFTAISYGRMANAYPSAGSAYTYVGRELHPGLGYLTGWSMIFDYIMNPVLSVIFCSNAVMDLIGLGQLAESAPYTSFGVFAVFVVFFAVLFTLLNLRGIEASSRTNAIIAAGLGLVVVWFLAAAARTILSASDLSAGRFLRPFYDPQTFSWGGISKGTAMAMLTYLGFDSISTLSEEARNPRRNILLATVLTCLITGLLASVEVYAAQLVWPSNVFPKAVTAVFDIAREAGGQPLYLTLLIALLVAQIGSGSGAHLGAGRLLYSMGRDNAIPSRFFGAIDARTRIPRNNIMLVGILALIGGLVISFKLSIELLNFGALVGFMGVNLSAFVRYFVRSDRKTVPSFVLPLLGFVLCLYVWWGLETMTKIVGLSWLALGTVYGAWKTKGFRQNPAFFTPEEEQ